MNPLHRFLEPDYEPKETEVVVHYHILPTREDRFHECLHALVESLQIFEDQASPKVFDLNQEYFRCRIAFPEELFEPGNLPQNLSVIAGSIFDNPVALSVKIIQITWSKKLEQTFPGPLKGMKKIREELNITHRPLSAVTLLPKAASTKQYLEKAYAIWMGGCDMVVENEMMGSTPLSEFQERIEFLSKERKNCSERTKRAKLYLPNITASTPEEMERRAHVCKESGLDFVLVNPLQIGWSALLSLSKTFEKMKLSFVTSNAGQGMYSRNTHSGFSPAALGSLYRSLGADLHLISSHSPDISDEIQALTKPNSKPQTLPVIAGNISPAEVEYYVKKFGHDLVLQSGRSLSEHPDGLKAGSEAFHYAIEAAANGIDLETAAGKNEALKRSLEKR